MDILQNEIQMVRKMHCMTDPEPSSQTPTRGDPASVWFVIVSNTICLASRNENLGSSSVVRMASRLGKQKQSLEH